uniref:Uncharacterized protein n=1 Tax=Panagrolaimus sp. ES5 TaxID=591445 RepID=A0AC34GKD8_9BILA
MESLHTALPAIPVDPVIAAAHRVSSPIAKTDSTQLSSAATAYEKSTDFGVQKAKQFTDGGIKTAEDKTKEPSEDLTLIQTAFPKMDVDPSKPFSKLFAADFIQRHATIAPPKYREPSIVPFLTRRINDKSVADSMLTPDCLIQQAVRLPFADERTTKLVQATIQANNQLYDLGFR